MHDQTLTKREQLVLQRLVEEYVRTAVPVSSQYLVRKYNLGVSSATVRNIFADLTRAGYIVQPHTSAGRVPTEQGYRFFVNAWEKERRKLQKDKSIRRAVRAGADRFPQNPLRAIAWTLANISRNVAVAGAREQIYVEGLSRLLRQPEFWNPEAVVDMIEFLEAVEDNLAGGFVADAEPRVYIGSENPFSRTPAWSMLVSPYTFSENSENVVGVIALIGPTRMHYPRNLLLLRAMEELKI